MAREVPSAAMKVGTPTGGAVGASDCGRNKKARKRNKEHRGVANKAPRAGGKHFAWEGEKKRKLDGRESLKNRHLAGGEVLKGEGFSLVEDAHVSSTAWYGREVGSKESKVMKGGYRSGRLGCKMDGFAKVGHNL